ncbi:MAG: hypothetical protein M3Z46_00010 [Actinomycetota bacterium]|nr:hypothetical protein [Actinomycetota bacterium]
MRKRIAATVIAASALTGGAIGLTVFGPSAVGAKTSPSTTSTTQPAPGAAAPGSDSKPNGAGHRFGFGHKRFGGAAVAKAIGISESDLTTALRSGKTIAQVAQAHGVTTQKVIDALVADGKTKIAAAVKSGKLTQAQADKVQAGLTKRITELVNGTFRGRREHSGFGGPGFGGPAFGGPGFGEPGFGGPGRGGMGHEHGRPTAAVAKAIGISESDLTTALRSGKTIAQVAQAHGVTTQKVIDALVADGKTKIAAAVKSGKLTQAQADKIEAGLTQQVTKLVNGTFRRGDGRPGIGSGRGMPRFDQPGA